MLTRSQFTSENVPVIIGVFVLLVLIAFGVTAAYSMTGTISHPPGPETSSPPQPPRNDTGLTVHVEEIAVAGTSKVTVTYSTPNGTREFVVEGVSPAMVDASEEWAYLSHRVLPRSLERAADDYAAGIGTVGRWALVGELDVASIQSGGTRVTVVTPAGMAIDPGRKAKFLVRFVSPYTLQASPDPVTLFVAPDALPSAGRMYGDEGYITQHAFWDGEVASVWIHEYVHARQAFTLTREMRWIREGMATYLSYRVMEEQYRGVTECDILARLAAVRDYTQTALANPAGWNETQSNYYRGAKLLYAIDAAIRSGSDGNRTLIDVVRAMNRRDGSVSIEEFVRLVERYAGEQSDWIRPAIMGTDSLDSRVQRASDVFQNRTSACR